MRLKTARCQNPPLNKKESTMLKKLAAALTRPL
jgi:hypothetical protein